MARVTREAYLMLLLVWWAPFVAAWSDTECSGVEQAFSACSSRWVELEPTLWSPCCEAMSGLSFVAESPSHEKQATCRCIMSLVASNSPFFSSVASLPAFCGVFLGFTIQPDVDCDSII